LNPAWGKKKKTTNGMIKKQLKKKRHAAKRTEHPELSEWGRGSPSHELSINKLDGEGRRGGPHPATLEWRKLVTVAVMWKAPPEGGEGHSPTRTVNKQASWRRPACLHLPQCAWRREGIQEQLKCGTLDQRMWEGQLPT
jgi:hypothetical protein